MAKSTGRPRSFDREAALDRATREFWAHGYAATSVATLTAAMGINPPSLYAAFGDKRKLFSAAVEHYKVNYGDLAGLAPEGGPGVKGEIERMLRGAAIAFTAPDRPHNCLIINGAVNCGPDNQDVAAELRAIRDLHKAGLVQRIAAAGIADAEPLGTYYAAVLQGMCAQARDGASRAVLDAAVIVAMRAWPDEVI